MEKINFSIDINAPKEKVWQILWDDASYKKWTSVFSEGSHAVTDWKQGSKVLFLDGKGSGMVSQIDTNRPNEYMSIKHLGMVKNGVEDLHSDEVKQWAGAHENYTLTEEGGATLLTIDIDMAEEHKTYFMDTFPLALKQIKTLSETNN
ncbi:MAG: SRPBCC domain-containing protein [Ferruginibacter sp.]